MHFSLESKPLGSVERFIVHAGDAELEILAGWGAGLNAWRIPVNGKILNLLYGYQDAETFRQIQADTNAGVCLSPFPGRTANAKWTWKGKSYQLENNVSWAPHALHGFLQTRAWKFKSFESNAQEAVLSLECEFYGDPAGYPFTYKITNDYAFSGNAFTVRSTVFNASSTSLPYAEGFHPYFSLGKKVDFLTLALPQCQKALLDSAGSPFWAKPLSTIISPSTPKPRSGRPSPSKIPKTATVWTFGKKRAKTFGGEFKSTRRPTAKASPWNL